jgi:hypothetical protein
VSDCALDPKGSRVAVITTRGYWIIYELKGRKMNATVLCSGTIDTSSEETEPVNDWWKLCWTDDADTVLVSGSMNLHILDINTGQSTVVLSAEPKQQFRGLNILDGLGGIAIAVLTTSEILIFDLIECRILLRQKHRRDADNSLILTSFSLDDGNHTELHLF